MTWTKPKISSALCLLAVIMGSVALFTDNWFQGPFWSVGFIRGCMYSVCVEIRPGIQLIDGLLNTDFELYYVLGVIVVIYFPLMQMFCAAVLKGISLFSGPSAIRDAFATVLVWIATYHGIGLVVLFIIIAAVKNRLLTDFTPPPIMGNGMIFNKMNKMLKMASQISIGWSAYVGLSANIIGLSSAVTSCPACEKDHHNQEEESNMTLHEYV